MFHGLSTADVRRPDWLEEFVDCGGESVETTCPVATEYILIDDPTSEKK